MVNFTHCDLRRRWIVVVDLRDGLGERLEEADHEVLRVGMLPNIFCVVRVDDHVVDDGRKR